MILKGFSLKCSSLAGKGELLLTWISVLISISHFNRNAGPGCTTHCLTRLILSTSFLRSGGCTGFCHSFIVFIAWLLRARDVLDSGETAARKRD